MKVVPEVTLVTIATLMTLVLVPTEGMKVTVVLNLLKVTKLVIVSVVT